MERGPSPEETAAIAAAIERFRADTAPATGDGKDARDPWRRAAFLEGISAKAAIDDLKGGVRWLS